MLTPTTIQAASVRPTAGRAAPREPLATSYGLTGSIDLMGAEMSYARNSEIYGDSEPAQYLYKVIGGAVRTYKVLSDGRRQIGAFYLPGDMFGIEMGDAHTFSAEAITDCRILVIKRTAVVRLAARDNHIAHQLWALTGRELQRMQDHILLLVKTARERVVAFLLEMASRMPVGNAVELPMPRQDIADYLGLTIETVSRTLSGLEHAAAIELPTSRRIVLRNRGALGRLNS